MSSKRNGVTAPAGSASAGIYDDQVAVLGLIGQLLDGITTPAKPPKPEPPCRARDWFDDGDDDDPVPEWRVA